MRDIFYTMFILVGPLLGLACYVLGPLGAVASSLVRVRPWWASPIVGLVLTPLLTLLCTPVWAFTGSPLPMPLPWLLAIIVDKESATTQSLKDNGVILVLVYATSLLAVLSFKGFVTAIRRWRAGRRSVGDEG